MIYTPIFQNGRDATCSWNKDGGNRYTNQSREPIGQESHVVSAQNYVRNFDFVPRFWSRLHDKNCLNILLSIKNSFFFYFDSQRQTALLHCDLQRQLTLSILTSRDNTLSFSYIWLPAVNPTKCILSATIFLPCSTFTGRLALASKTTTKISSNHRKKQTTNMGEDSFLLTYIIKIL